MIECPFCTKELSTVLDVRYCNVCKDAGRIPDPDLGDDWPLNEELTAMFLGDRTEPEPKAELNPATNEMPHADPERGDLAVDPQTILSKSVLKRKAVQKAKRKAKVKAKAKNKPKKKRK